MNVLWKFEDFHGGFVGLACLRISFDGGWISSQLTAHEALRYDWVIRAEWTHIMIFHNQLSRRIDYSLSHRMVIASNISA